MISTDEKKKRHMYQDSNGIKRVIEGNDILYRLKLHETTMIGNNTVVLRVPDGWIYTQTITDGHNKGRSVSITSVLVPYSNEFS